MKLDILFWFYKDIEVCQNKIDIINYYNPDANVYGLFGGSPFEAKLYEKKLTGLADFYATPVEDSHWKWINGDLELLNWFSNRGKDLSWDSLVISQWDLLPLEDYDSIFKSMEQDEVFFPGFRPLDAEMLAKWSWVTEDKANKAPEFKKFKHLLDSKFEKTPQMYANIFLTSVLSRSFFEMYEKVPDVEVGMLEYKMPTYAKMYDIPVREIDTGIAWFPEDGNHNMPLTARKNDISKDYILNEMTKESGWRMFHPYTSIWKNVTIGDFNE